MDKILGFFKHQDKKPEDHHAYIKDHVFKIHETNDNKEKLKILKKIRRYLELFKDEWTTPRPVKKRMHITLPSQTKIEYPTDEAEIQRTIKEAYEDGNTIVRVIGSGHSVPEAILDVSDISGKKKIRFLCLEKYHGVEIDYKNHTATVKAGTHLNRDPEDIENSTLQNSFNYIIDQAGYALPDLGGIAHQTVGGFISTGSAGGSLIHNVHDSIIKIRIIDGKGDIYDLSIDDEDNSKFLAAGVSLGLLGIITKVTFKLMKNYYITGNQIIAPITPLSNDFKVGCPIDLLGDGDREQKIPSIYEFFTKSKEYDADYARIFWWPQEGVNRLTIWRAKPIPIPSIDEKSLSIKPYNEFPVFAGSEIPAQLVASLVMIALNLFSSENRFYKRIAAYLINLFNPIGIQEFQDKWYSGLPMDDKVSDTIFPATFSELLFPIEKTNDIVHALNKLYKTGGEKVIGNFTTELYTTKKSHFWLSQSYNTDSIRIDIQYFQKNPIGTSREFFKQYWDAFYPYNFRCHWGKHIPEGYGKRIRSLYEKYDDWMKVREEMDPKQVNYILIIK
ncbi:16389_t:CDS:2 [Dentiscutata heterogama]|uniref:16389_t:CDS:1 n=1 Tax=Dentiscutata heterogama TaxID=1316150 RepID=A0ACA9LAR0_9GLOM|nr:16389_t:CDS:2 [Dentiscutata heterogama]